MLTSTESSRAISVSLTQVVIVTVAVALVVRLPFLSWPLTVDEAGYAYGARWWFEGVTMYSDQLWFDRPQGIFVAYQVGSWLFGDSVEAIRVNGALWAAGTAALVAWIASEIFDRRVALVAGPLYAIVSVAPALEGFVANAEIFMLLPATASTALIWRRRWFAAGILAGVAILLKPSGVSIGLIAFAWLLYERESWRAWIAMAVGTASPLIAALLHGIVTVGLEDYLFAVALFRAEAGGQNHPIPALIVYGAATSPAWLPLLLLVPLAMRYGLGRFSRARTFIAVWFAASVLGMAMGANWWPHYFVQMIPPLVLVAAFGLVRGMEQNRLELRSSGVVGTVAAVAMVGFLVVPMAVAERAEATTRVFHSEHYLHSDQVAAYLNERTSPEESIYVPMGHASIVHLSDRRSSWPYLYGQQTAMIPGAIEDAADHVARGVPTYIVVQHERLDRWDPRDLIRTALASSYELETTIGALEIWRRS